MMTQSVGVPRMAKRRSSTWRMRIGSDRVSGMRDAGLVVSGATTQTSSERRAGDRSATSSPGAWMPSSLVTRIFMARPVPGRPYTGQCVRHGYRAVLVLVGFHHGDKRAADGDAGAIEGVDELGPAVAPEASFHAARLEIAADRAGGDLAIGLLPGSQTSRS
jgi:hypothetical protein